MDTVKPDVDEQARRILADQFQIGERVTAAGVVAAVAAAEARGREQGRREQIDKLLAEALNIEIALVRVYCGDPPPLLNSAERRTVVTILTEAGWPAWRIAVALGLAQRSVVRHRSAARAAAAVAA